MPIKILILLMMLPVVLNAQEVTILPSTLDAGVIEEAGSLTTFAVLHNQSAKVQYILRANSSKQTDVYVSRKKLEPGDTVQLRLRYRPIAAGRFTEELEVYVSGDEHPIQLVLKGEIRKLLKDELQACVSFSQKEPDEGMRLIKMPTTHVPLPTPVKEEALDPEKFKPINLILLIDVSGSMNNEEKLPVLKASMQNLFKVLRPGDKISIVTYATDVKVLGDGIDGNEQELLMSLTDSLKAGGHTAGSQGLRQAYELADQQYINGGNNQVILATDGNFGVRNVERKMIEARAEEMQHPLKLSVLAYGEEATYHKRLKVLSDKGKGSFIYVRKAGKSESILLEEIKKQSARNN